MGKEMHRREKRMMKSLRGTKVIPGERKPILKYKDNDEVFWWTSVA